MKLLPRLIPNNLRKKFRHYKQTRQKLNKFPPERYPVKWIKHLFFHKKLHLNQKKASQYLDKLEWQSHQHGSYGEWSKLIVDYLSLVETGKMSHDQATSEILSKAKIQDPTAYSYQFWLDLKKLLFLVGFIRAGGKLRDCALDSLLSSAVSNNQSVNPASVFQAAIEIGDFKTAANIEELARLKIEKSRASLLQPTLQALSGKGRSVNQKIEVSEDAQELYSFAEYIRDKSVAIVGPSVTDTDLSEEIDSYDIVIRTKFTGEESLPPGAGKKTSASYYAKTSILTKTDPSLIASLELVLLNYQTTKGEKIDSKKLKELGLNTNSIALLLPTSGVFFAAEPNAIPHLVHDTLFAEPRVIKLFKTNLFVNPKYPSGYPNSKITSVATTKELRPRLFNRYKGFAYHDPLAQLRFLRQTWKAGLIAGDSEFSEVMNLSDEEYLRYLESVYSLSRALNS